MRMRQKQRGNIFTLLLGGIMLSGMLGIAMYQLMGGPVFGTIKLAKQTTAQAQIQTVGRMIITAAANQPATTSTQIPGDCDGDNSVEPPEWRAAGSTPHPSDDGTGGPVPGLVPLTIGAPVTDPWGTDYGYCVWDVGATVKGVGGGGATLISGGGPAAGGCLTAGAQKRLSGSASPKTGAAVTQTVIAVISAGPDKTFQTTCKNYVDASTDLISTSGDDIVTRYTYSEAAQATSSAWNVKSGTPGIASTANNLQVGNSSSKQALTANASSVSATSLSATGKVITTAGATILGNQTQVLDIECDAGHAGLLRYNTASNSGGGAVQFCNGSTFTDVVGGGGGGAGTPAAGSATQLSQLTLIPDVSTDFSGDVACGTSPATVCYLGLGKGALNPVPTGVPHSVTNYNTITKVQGPSAMVQAGNLGATSGAGLSTSLTGASAPAANDTIVVEVNANSFNSTTAGTALSGFTVTDTTANAVSGSDNIAAATSHTYLVGSSEVGCTSTNGATAIYYYTYAAAPGNTTITVKPNTAASMNISVSEYSNILKSSAAAGAAGSTVDRYGVTTSSSNIAAQTATANTGTNSGAANKLLISTFDECGYTSATNTITDNNTGSYPIGTEGPSVGPGWSSLDYSDTSNPTTGSKFANGAAAHQITTAVMASNPVQVWNFSNHNTAPKGAVSAIATFVPTSTVTSTPLPSYPTAVGYNALHALTQGADDTALGDSALTLATTSSDNTAAGYHALAGLITGTGTNTAVGSSALAAATSGPNVAIGKSSQAAITTATQNTTVGYNALGAGTISSADTVIGTGAMPLAAGVVTDWSGANNNALTVFGHHAFAALTLPNQFYYANAFGYQACAGCLQESNGDFFGYNAAAVENGAAGPDDVQGFGANALGSAGTGANEFAFGYNAGLHVSAGSGTQAFGYGSQATNTTELNDTSFGYSALANTDDASFTTAGHTAFGYQALMANTNSVHNTAFGYNTLATNTTGSNITAFGTSANAGGTAPTGSVSFGYQALMANTMTGSVGVGWNALATKPSGTPDVAVGAGALASSTGDRNTAFGALALYSNTQGTDNTAAGAQALYNNSSTTLSGVTTYGSYNTAVGAQALYGNLSGQDNTAIGAQALYSNTIGNYNTAVGDSALYLNQQGSDNTAVGYQAMYNNDSKLPGVVQAIPMSNNGGVWATSGSISFSTLPAAGNTIIVAVESANGVASVTDNQGGTYANTGATDTALDTFMYYRSNISPPSGTFTITVTLNGSAAGFVWSAIEVSGLANASVVDQWAAGLGAPCTNPGSSACTVTTSATTQINELAVSMFKGHVVPGPTSMSNSAGWMQDAILDMGAPGGDAATLAHKAIPFPAVVSNTVSTGGTPANEWTMWGGVVTFKSNPTYGGDPGNANTAMGGQALFSNTSGDGNTALGWQSLVLNQSGSYNAAGGAFSMYSNVSGSDNVGWGYQALYSSVSDIGATAAGYQAMYHSNTAGSKNTAIGDSALYTTVTDTSNTAVGYHALYAQAGGGNNTAIGTSALAAVTVGTGNTAVGTGAGANITTGNNNTAVGYGAGPAASYNTAISAAAQSGSNVQLTVASSASFLGGDYVYITGCASGSINGAQQIVTGSPGGIVDGTHVKLTLAWASGMTCGAGTMTSSISNTTTIGYQATASNSNQIRLGNASVTTLNAYGLAPTVYSDRRLKQDIKDSDLGLDFIMKLRPVSFHRIGAGPRDEYGFIAQEVQDALGARIANMIIQDNDAMHTWMMRMEDLIAPLVKAVQQQETVEQSQDKEITALKDRLKAAKTKLEELKKAREHPAARKKEAAP